MTDARNDGRSPADLREVVITPASFAAPRARP